MDGIAVDCPVKVSGVGKLLFRFILPLAFFVNVGILYMIFRLLRRSSVPGQSVEAVFFKALLSISTFALMPLVEASVALLDCRKIMGSFGSHVGPVSFAIFVILLLLVAHPIALVSLLMKMKKENPEFMLMEAYFIIERGLIVIFFTVFPEENRWSAFGYIILFGSIMSVRLYLQPFQDKLEDYLNREISLCWLMLLAFKYTSFGSNDHDIAPYVIAIMFLPPTLHVLRLVISYSSGNSRHIARSKDEIYEAKTTKKGGYDKNDPERVPLSHGNLNEI
ncbi:hypothetical protein BC829DRAFT_393980 [Chytridium lagenaria]|nr:hypothetical protein BC829DRAFT_393980 [Chytridium lagenaria]